MKKLILLFAIFAQMGYGQTLTISGTTYEITGSELLTIANSYAQGASSCPSNSCSVVLSQERGFNLATGNYMYALTLIDGDIEPSLQNVPRGTQYCLRTNTPFYKYVEEMYYDDDNDGVTDRTFTWVWLGGYRDVTVGTDPEFRAVTFQQPGGPTRRLISITRLN